MKIKFFGILLLGSICIIGCKRSYLDRKLTGRWAVDINPEMVERNNWGNILGNVFSLESDFSCDMIGFKNTVTNNFYNSYGTWYSLSVNDRDSLIIDVKNHPMSGRYKVEFFRDYEKKHLKMRVSNSSVEFTCGKFLQDFDNMKKW